MYSVILILIRSLARHTQSFNNGRSYVVIEYQYLSEMCFVWLSSWITRPSVLYMSLFCSNMVCSYARSPSSRFCDRLDFHTIISDTVRPHVENFLIRYAFQVSLYHVWTERNRWRHGDTHSTPQQLIKFIDKVVRNRICSIRTADNHYDDGLIIWFEARDCSQRWKGFVSNYINDLSFDLLNQTM